MVERLKSALKNPVSPLALKAALAALGAIWLRYGELSWWKTTIFLLLAFYCYLSPKTNFAKFALSSIILLGVIFRAPNLDGLMGFYLSLVLAILVFILLGIKNLILLRRQGVYYFLHLMLVVGVASLFFLGSLSQIVFFITLFFLLREFYVFFLKENIELINLIAAVEGILLIQAAWVISFFPTSFLVGASFLVLITYVFHDVLLGHFRGLLNKQLIFRDFGLFVVLTGLILLMPVWGFQ